MAKSDKRMKALANSRAQKASRFKAAASRGDQAGKSKYATKTARKLGRGRVEPGWMWWLERAADRTAGVAFRVEAAA